MTQDLIKEFVETFGDRHCKDVVYIAGPFASDPTGNTQKAINLGFVCSSVGYAPYVPHTTILSGAYGRDEVPAEREQGMLITLSILTMIAQQESSELWVIQNEDSTLSDGTQIELDLWCSIRSKLEYSPNTYIKTYKQWLTSSTKVQQ